MLSLTGGLVAAACGATPTEACPSSSITPGRWEYSAVQLSPVRVTLDGTLSVSSVQCGDFLGSIDLMSADALGRQRRLAGPVSGRAVSATAIRFDVEIDANIAQHVGVLSADSMRGSWVSVAGRTTTSGTFRGRRGNGP
jgi:hypothetical protein